MLRCAALRPPLPPPLPHPRPRPPPPPSPLQTRELRERLARAESHLGGALGELQTVVGAELGAIKEVLGQLEAAMNTGELHSWSTRSDSC
jgi:hypothetical protein